MGNESSIFGDCEWESPITYDLWTIHHGKLADGTEISRFDVSTNDKKHYDVMRKLTMNLKLVRHPSILTFLYSEEGSLGPDLITEKAIPLQDVLQSLSPTEVCAGLHTILDALSFLHESVGSSHNNVHIGAVYVTSDGSWRLGGLEHMCKFSECSNAYLESCKVWRNESVITPEEKQGKVSTDESLAHTRDIYAFAVMVESLIEKLDDLGDLTKTFELRIQDECLNTDPRQRPKAKSLLSDRLFNTDFLEIALFLKNITLKSEQERKLFFRNLLPKLLSLPEELTARRLVPGMLSRFVFLDQSAVENVLPNVLTPKKDGITGVTPLFSENVFRQFIAPKLVRIFSVHDFHVHIILLQHFHSFVHLIDKEDLELDVFPQVLLGLRDTSDQIASLSLHALADMIPILGRDIVIGGKSKTYFKEGLPKSQGMLPNNKYSNVRGMAEKVRLVDLTTDSTYRDNGRPVNITKMDDDADRKWKEKEQRREEMRRKREERKLAREKSKALKKKDSDNESDKPDSPRNANHLNDSPDRHLNVTSDIDAKNSSVLDKSHDSHGTEENEKEWSNENFEETANEPEVIVEDVDDWTGWSDDGGGSNYSDEIEKELESMESSSVSETNPISITDKISISNYSKQGAMKLVPKTAKSDKKKSEAEIEVDKLVDDTKRKSQSIKPTPTTNAKKNKALGSEFDIMNLDIKVNKTVQDPFDFFADMAPKIESKKVNPQETVNEYVENKVTDETGEPSKSYLSFSVQAENIEDSDAGGGWGEEDW